MVIAEERPRLALTQSFSKLFKDLGLSPRAVSTAFGSRVNLAICLQVGPSAHTGTHIQMLGVAKKYACMHTHTQLDLNNDGDSFGLFRSRSSLSVSLPGYSWTRSLHRLCRHEVPPP